MANVREQVSPFKGGPETKELTSADGTPAILVIAQGRDPFRMKLAWRFTVGYFLVQGFSIGLNLVETNAPQDAWISGGLTLLFLTWIVWSIGKWFSWRSRRVYFTPTEFVVVNRWTERGGEQAFDLNQPHRFSMLPHDKALDEKRAHELAKSRGAQKRQVANPGIYYQDSYHICFDYHGQRYDLLTVYGKKPALAILQRLKACAEINKARSGRDGRAATAPSQQWKATPGDIADGPGRDVKLN